MTDSFAADVIHEAAALASIAAFVAMIAVWTGAFSGVL